MKAFCFSIVVSVLFHTLSAVKFEESVNSGNKTRILLGGLFAVHEKNNVECGVLRRSSVVKVESMAYAIRSINQREDILPDAVLEFDIRDTCESTNIALEEVVEMMDFNTNSESSSKPGVSGLIGATQTDTSIAIARLGRLFQIPQISFSATASILSDKSRFDYFFRTIPSDILQARAMADLIMYFNWTYIIVINSDDTYGRDGVSGLMNELNTNSSSSICIVSDPKVTELSVHGNNNYNRVIDYILQEWVANASVVVLFSQFSTALNLLEAVKVSPKRDQLRSLTWIAGDSWATRIADPSIGRLVRGMIGTTPSVYPVTEFNSYLESLHPNNYSANPWFAEYWEEVFNCSLNSSQPMKMCDNSQRLVTHDIQEDVNDVSNVINAVYAYAHAMHDMMQDNCSPPHNNTPCSNILNKRFAKYVINGDLLRDYLKNVSFNSSSNHETKFDEWGDVEGEYTVVNMNTSRNFKHVGLWNSLDKLQIIASVQWFTENNEVPVSICSLPCDVGHHPVLVPETTHCCWTCDKCIGTNTVSNGSMCIECPRGMSPDEQGGECLTNPIIFLTWENPWAILIMLGSGLGLTLTAFVAIIFIRFNTAKVIKATSRELCAILFIGIIACYILPFFYLAKPSVVICTFRRMGIGLVFSICFSPMLLRANRIYRVFHDAPQTPRFAGPLYQVLFSCCFIAGAVLISIVWLVVEKPGIQYTYDSLTTELRCGESPYIGLAVTLLYNFALLGFSTYFAFLSRKIPAKFNETKFLGITLYSVCMIWLTTIPTYFATVRFGVVYQTTSLLMAVLLSATTTLACLLLPKAVIVLWYLWMEKRHHSVKYNSQIMETETTSNGTL